MNNVEKLIINLENLAIQEGIVRERINNPETTDEQKRKYHAQAVKLAKLRDVLRKMFMYQFNMMLPEFPESKKSLSIDDIDEAMDKVVEEINNNIKQAEDFMKSSEDFLNNLDNLD